MAPKIFWVQKLIGTKKILSLKNFSVLKNWVPKYYGPKNLIYNYSWAPNIVVIGTCPNLEPLFETKAQHFERGEPFVKNFVEKGTFPKNGTSFLEYFPPCTNQDD